MAQNIIPDEYKDQVYDLEDFQRARIAAAIQNAKTRKGAHVAPKWWRPENGFYNDCIGTATDNYGEDSTEIGNQTFLKNYKQKGFRLLQQGENPQEGDIVQYVYKGSPFHSTIITGFDKLGRLEGYSDGSGNYYPSSSYWSDYAKKYGYNENVYRYIGTPAEQQAIADHNAAIRSRNAASVQPIPVPVQGIPVQPAQLPKRVPTIFDVAKGEE